jgi:superfamily II DNA or RNA helicase
MEIKLPSVYAINESINKNSIRQLVVSDCSINATIANFSSPEVKKGKLLISTENPDDRILCVEKSVPPISGHKKVIQIKFEQFEEKNSVIDLTSGKWLFHSGLLKDLSDASDYRSQITSIINSWNNAFSYLEEKPVENIKGLRSPQIGAVHAVHAHWTVSEEPATIIMPTGTGKTETMLSVLLSKKCQKLLVIVPTDALRSQIAKKFITLGILKDKNCKVLLETAQYPVVGTLKHIPKSRDEVDSFFERCNVVITTSSIAGSCSEEIQERMSFHCTHLFIDEAHHVAAPTWQTFKEKFADRLILQFTATPFREDDKPVEGKIIFKYPLRKAQEEDYFKPIKYEPVYEFEPSKFDEAIADKAIEVLRESPDNYILMARVADVDRAREVFPLYQKYTEYNPVEIHYGIKSTSEREKIRHQILSGKSRIVVCVNMLGEGFDLPELKIAAFHDVRKALTTTLQLAGRFTRSRPDLGHATFIANEGNIEVGEELKKLYRRDTDWNYVLPIISDGKIEEEIEFKEFIEGFENFPKDIPLTSIRPATSTVIYKTKCDDWNPDNFMKGIKAIGAAEKVFHDVNYKENVLIAITSQRTQVDWTDVKDVYSWSWNLHIVVWDQEQKLLFIHGSNTGSYYKALAQAVAGDDVTLLKGDVVFRCFHEINRLKFQNIGLTERQSRLVRYTGRMGSDVEAALTEIQRNKANKSVLFGSGFENARLDTIGASRRGRIWSFKTTNLKTLVNWCKHVGKKILDDSIDPDEILKGTPEAKVVLTRPPVMPIAADWSEIFYKETEAAFTFVFEDGTESPFYETSLSLVDHSKTGEIKFSISSETSSVDMVLRLFEKDGIKDFEILTVGGRRLTLKYKSTIVPVESFFNEHPPVIWFVDGSSLDGNVLTTIRIKPEPYDKNKIQTRTWSGVNLKKESQHSVRRPDSIQYYVIQELKKKDYDIVFDDDGKGESADIVTVRVNDDEGKGNTINVEFYHCKYSKEASPGARLEDLYEVCGQAQKSIQWMRSHTKQTELFSHLLRRESKRLLRKASTRFEIGDKNELLKLREMSHQYPMKLKIYIVQPGLSVKEAGQEHLELLSVTENYLAETYMVPFEVLASI